MTSRILDWKSKEGLAVGKGATVQEHVAIVGDKKLELDVAPWGEGHLKVNGREIAHIDDAKDRRQAFRHLAKTAERYLQGQVLEPESKRKSSMISVVKAKSSKAREVLLLALPTRIRSRGAAPRLSEHSGLSLPLPTSTIRRRNTSIRSPASRSLHPYATRRAHARSDGSGVRAHREGLGSLDFVVHSIAFSPRRRCRGASSMSRGQFVNSIPCGTAVPACEGSDEIRSTTSTASSSPCSAERRPRGRSRQGQSKVAPVIGVLRINPKVSDIFSEPFRRYMPAAGWVEGRNVLDNFVWADMRIERVPALAAYVDLIATFGDPAIRAVQQATSRISIVEMADDLIASGLVASMARPGGNTTGVSILVRSLT